MSNIYGARNPKKKFQMRIVDNSAPKTWDSLGSTIRQKKMASGVAAKIVTDFIAASSNHLHGMMPPVLRRLLLSSSLFDCCVPPVADAAQHPWQLPCGQAASTSLMASSAIVWALTATSSMALLAIIRALAAASLMALSTPTKSMNTAA